MDGYSAIMVQGFEHCQEATDNPFSTSGYQPIYSTHDSSFAHYTIARRPIAFGECGGSNSVKRNPQAAFDAARRTVAHSLRGRIDRDAQIQSIGHSFTIDAIAAAEFMPQLLGLSQDASLLQSDGRFQASTPVLVDAGGLAGGAKAVHEDNSLFLKTPNDAHGIYGSDVMAAKVMRLEAKAARWIHGMDSIHVSTPLCAVVDVAYTRSDCPSDEKNIGTPLASIGQICMPRVHLCDSSNAAPISVQRVMVQARVAVDRETLRFGSHDGGSEMHQDESQYEKVVLPLAQRFHLAPMRLQGVKSVVNHSYHSMPPEDLGVCDALGPLGTGQQPADWLEHLRSEGVTLAQITEGQMLRHATRSSADIALGVALPSHDMRKSMAPGEDVIAHIDASSASFETAVTRERIQHVATESPVPLHGDPEHIIEHSLPFDVEVHQMPTGHRMVLDTHRLLMPDTSWIRWMRTDPDAAPMVWVVTVPQTGSTGGSMARGASPAVIGLAATGQLRGIPNLVHWSRAFSTVQADGLIGQESEHDYCQEGRHIAAAQLLIEVALERWVREQPELDVNESPGCIHAISTHQGAGLAQFVRNSVEGASGSTPRLHIVVSCPGWYFGRQPYLTCMMPPEAAAVAQALLSENGDQLPSVSPDCIMRHGFDPDLQARKRLDHVTSSICSSERLVEAATLLEAKAADPGCVAPPGDTAANAESDANPVAPIGYLRHHAKIVLHSLGLGLRHIGRVIPLLDMRGKGVVRMAWASCLPSPGSVTGVALSTALEQQYDTDAAASSTAIQLCILQARAFACRGARLELDGASQIAVAMDILEQFRMQCRSIKPGNCRHTAPVGLDEAYSHSSTAHASDGSMVWARSRQSISQMLSELAHVQRVGGSGELSLLQQIIDVAGQGVEFHPLACRGILRICALRHHSLGLGMASLQDTAADVSSEITAQQRKNYFAELAQMVICMSRLGFSSDALILQRHIVVCSHASNQDCGDAEYRQLHNLACNLFAAAQYEEALEIQLRRQGLLLKSIGSENETYLHAVVSAAAAMSRLGRLDEALALFMQGIEGLARVVGKKAPVYLATVNNMCDCLGMMDRHGEALVWQTKCRDTQAIELGMAHPHYLGTINNMAGSLTLLGRHTEAAQLTLDTLPHFEAVLGPKHPNYLIAFGRAAGRLVTVERFDEAIELFRKCEACFECNPSLDANIFYILVRQHAKCLVKAGRVQEADELFGKWVERELVSNGTNSPRYADLLYHWGALLFGADVFDVAASKLSLCIDCRSRLSGQGHPTTLEAMKMLSECFRSVGRVQEAVAMYRQVKTGMESNAAQAADPADTDHGMSVLLASMSYLELCNNLCACLHQLQQFAEAVAESSRIREPMRVVAGETSERYLTALNNEGMALDAMGRYQEGLDIMQHCLGIQERVLGTDHIDCHLSRLYMATMHDSLGNANEAIKLYRVALDGHERLRGPHHQHTLEAYQYMSKFMHDQGRYAEAIKLRTHFVEALRGIGGNDHPKWVPVNMDLAISCRAVGQFADAFIAVEAAMAGRGSPDIAHELFALRQVVFSEMTQSVAGAFATGSREGGYASPRRAIGEHRMTDKNDHQPSTRATCMQQSRWSSVEVRQVDSSKLMAALKANSKALKETEGSAQLAIDGDETALFEELVPWLDAIRDDDELDGCMPLDGSHVVAVRQLVYGKLLHWPIDVLPPALDLIRMLVLSAQWAHGDTSSEDLMRLIEMVIRAACDPGASTGLRTVAARTLVNCLTNDAVVTVAVGADTTPSGSGYLCRILDEVIPALDMLSLSKPAQARRIPDILLNLAIAVRTHSQEAGLESDTAAKWEEGSVVLVADLACKTNSIVKQLQNYTPADGVKPSLESAASTRPQMSISGIMSSLHGYLMAITIVLGASEGARAAAYTVDGLSSSLSYLATGLPAWMGMDQDKDHDLDQGSRQELCLAEIIRAAAEAMDAMLLE